MASGYHIGHCRYRICPSTQKILLDRAALVNKVIEKTYF